MVAAVNSSGLCGLRAWRVPVVLPDPRRSWLRPVRVNRQSKAAGFRVLVLIRRRRQVDIKRLFLVFRSGTATKSSPGRRSRSGGGGIWVAMYLPTYGGVTTVSYLSPQGR